MSKELEALKRLKKTYFEKTQKALSITFNSFEKQCSIIEKALKDKEKTDKVLEIIKKNCDVENIIAFCTRSAKEQDLLKEVLR